MAYKKDAWGAVDVRCPFYISDARQERFVRCEGYSEGNSLISSFRSNKDMNSHMGSYCAGRYERCPVYGLVYSEKYDD